MMMVVVMVVVEVTLLTGSDALECYQCENVLQGESLDVRGKKCFDPSLPMATCEARQYCTKLEFNCPIRMSHSAFILLYRLV